jgi:hypothetical protein
MGCATIISPRLPVLGCIVRDIATELTLVLGGVMPAADKA